MMKHTKFQAALRSVTALVLTLCITLSLCPQLVGTAYAAAESALDKLVNWGVVHGYPDGSLRPERTLSRAEFVAMVNRAYGYKKTGETPFIDVSPESWYYDDIGIAYNANYFNGISPRQAGPDTSLTREQALVLLARNMRLDPIGGEVTEFEDGRSFSSWSRGYARAARQLGVITGYGDGTFRPQNNITRGDMASMLQRALGTLVNTPGTHTLSDVYGNVTISSTNTTLKDSTIAGNLYVTGGLDLGDITLDNVRVLGDIIVAGGGESHSGEDSIILRNVMADSLLVDSIADQFVTLRAEGDTEIGSAELRSDSYVQDRTRPGQGFLNLSLDSEDANASFTLSGNLETVVNKTPGSTLNIAMGTVDALTIDETARNSSLNLDISSTANTLNLDTATGVTGVGDIGKVIVNAAGSSVEMLPDQISIRPGLTANIAGQDMNAVQAQESSSDPRLLAGYPKVKNIAPTTATALFSANKAGKVYWAVSATANGSISEDELITPTQGNTFLLQNGNLDIAKSNTESSSALTTLAPDGSYYLSAVMVDSRDRRSPVKVTSFATPDNTTPAFNTGYPMISLNDYTTAVEEKTVDGKNVLVKVPKFRAQVAAMPNKSCQLYYALYPAGSTAPTVQQFRAGALGKTIAAGSGVEDVTKNEPWYKTFTGLAERTAYDLYLCLIDADGARSSAVQRLTFTTMDGTPPEFRYDTPEVDGTPQATAIPTRVNVNEPGTIYWVVVRAGSDYIGEASLKSVAGSDALAAHITGYSEDAKYSPSLLLDALTVISLENIKASSDQLYNKLEAVKRKIESGTGSVRNGQNTATANRDTAVNLTGLANETAYDIYYVIKDAAGNYSDIAVLEGKHTLDTTPPTVSQDFSHKNESGNPFTDTEVYLIFSEDVKLASPPTNGTTDDERALYKILADKSLSQLHPGAELGEFLSRSVRFYNDSGISPTVRDTTSIDYSKAKVELDSTTGEVKVTFPNDGVQLKSDATYHFEFVNLQDLADTPNRMQDAASRLDPFRMVAASVTLRTLNVTSINDGAVPIDMAFSLTPTSTDVEDDVDWDLVFWSDSSVGFQVYELSSGNINGNTGTAITQAGRTAPSNVEIVNDNSPTAADVTADDYQGYIGRSLFRDFYGLNFFPSVTGKGNAISNAPEKGTLSGKAKYYGIHFTSINHTSEGDDGNNRKAWDATVNFRVSVLTGTSANLTNLASNITKNRLAESEAHWGITQIHAPRPFSMRKMFANSEAPSFVAGYPQILASDVSASLNFMLDRAGTLYYAIAPVDETVENNTLIYTPSILTRLSNNQAVTGGNIDSIPPFGNNNPALLSLPTPDKIYSPNFGNNAIKTGRISLGTGNQSISLNDLTANTLYFAYFVTQGEGQVYSDNVMIYQFRTHAVNRPKLFIANSGSSIVNVRSRNMNAVADYAVFQMTGLPTEFSEAFENAIDKDAFTYDATDGAIYKKEDIAKTQKLATVPQPANGDAKYTVYEAMTNQYSSGGSLYDEYASAAHKDTVRKIITGQTYSGGRIDNSSGVALTQDINNTVDCAAAYSIQAGQQYLFIASARSRVADDSISADAYGYSAYQPIYIIDDTPPVISTVSGNVTVDRTSGTPQITGNIYLTFDKDLYYYASATNKLLFATAGDSSTKSIKDFQYLSGSSTMDSGTMKPVSITASRTVALSVTNAVSGNNFLATPNLVSYYSSPNFANPLEFTLRYDRSAGKVYVDFKSPAWYRFGSAELTTKVIAPAVESISLTPSSLSLDIGQSYTVSTIFSPSSSSGDIVWTVSGDSSAISIIPDGNSVIVTALRKTAAGAPARIRATVDGTPAATAVIEITVTATPVIEIIHDNNNVTNGVIRIQRGETVTLGCVARNVATPFTTTWSSTNPNYLPIGLYTGSIQAAGAVTDHATVTVMVNDGNGTYTASCYVQIVE